MESTCTREISKNIPNRSEHFNLIVVNVFQHHEFNKLTKHGKLP